MAKEVKSPEKKMIEKPESVKCEKCGLEFPGSELSEKHKNRAFVWKNQTLCGDCLFLVGGDPNVARELWSFQSGPDSAKPHDW